MLQVRTKLKESPIHGIGVFADITILQGTLVWKFDALLDMKVSKTMVGGLPPLNHAYFYKHCYVNPDEPNWMVMCIDNARFINFSNHPNLVMIDAKDNGEKRLIANRMIGLGEELTVGSETDADYSRKMNLV